MTVHPIRQQKTTSGADDQELLRWVAPYLPPALKEVNVPCYILDRSGKIRWLNGAAMKLLGDVRGLPYTAVVDGGQSHSAHRRFANQIRGVRQPDVTIDLHGLDGRKARVQISSCPLRGNHHAIGVFGLATTAPPRAEPRTHHHLTPRQHDVLERLSHGASTDQIAADLHLSRDTVRNHVRHILRRLDARSRLEAVAVAHREGIL
jgi:DNA-binding CsgD family transcriptional regulator